MSEFVGWDVFFRHERHETRGGIPRLRLEPGNAYRVPLIGPLLRYHKYLIAGRSAICADPSICPVRMKYNIEPGTRYAINALDRQDLNFATDVPVLKIMEVPRSVLMPMAEWWRRTNHDPAGAVGPDFAIDVTGNGNATRWSVKALEVTPFTADQKEYVKNTLYDLLRIYRATPPDEIEGRLFGQG